MEVKIDNLTRQVERHNCLIERTYALEQDVAVVKVEIEIMLWKLCWGYSLYHTVATAGTTCASRLVPVRTKSCAFCSLAFRSLTSLVNPLLMSFFEDLISGSLPYNDFASMLRTTESYLFRRSVCDVATNSLNKFFSSVIARLNAARNDGGNIREAYEAILPGEEGTARRMPSDAEFERALRTRDCYAFKRGFYLLITLENSWHAKDPLDFSDGNFSIEHKMLTQRVSAETLKGQSG